MKKSYLYIGCYYDIKGRESSINDKKIGITKDPSSRENALNSTKGPIGYTFIKLWEFEGEERARIVEKQIFHNLLSDSNTNGEWFSDDKNDLVESVDSSIKALVSLGVPCKEISIESKVKISRVEEEVIKNNKPTSLVVTIDGQKIEGEKSYRTFSRAIEILGVEEAQIALGEKVITKNDECGFRQHETIGDYKINVWSGNDTKSRQLNKISSYFESKGKKIDMKVEMV